MPANLKRSAPFPVYDNPNANLSNEEPTKGPRGRLLFNSPRPVRRIDCFFFFCFFFSREHQRPRVPPTCAEIARDGSSSTRTERAEAFAARGAPIDRSIESRTFDAIRTLTWREHEIEENTLNKRKKKRKKKKNSFASSRRERSFRPRQNNNLPLSNAVLCHRE